jgi:hypothetical protein
VPLAAALFLFTAIVFIWNLTGLISGLQIRTGPRLRLRPGRGKTLVAALLALALINWAYRILMGFD